MELQAIVHGLSVLKKPCEIKVTTDSQYAKNAFTAGWLTSWQKNGWKTADKKPVKNQDLWMILSELRRTHSLSWAWVKGHSGDRFNDMCDTLATQAIIHRAGIDERLVDHL